jgi:hypothetical protein
VGIKCISIEDLCTYNDKCRCQLHGNGWDVFIMASADVSYMEIVVKSLYVASTSMRHYVLYPAQS